MKKTTLLLWIACLVLGAVYGQNNRKKIDELNASIEAYYSLSRENIHVHFNKQVYLAGEKIWLKGYVYNQQTQLLFAETTNVFVEVFDDRQHLIERKLLFAHDGTFQTHLELNEKWHSGKYHVRFYTHYMNNFQEDLSATYALQVVNASDRTYSVNTPANLSSATITVRPESGIFLLDTDATISVKIKDCYGNGLEVKQVRVLDEDDKEVAVFYTNQYGYGRFTILNAKKKEYRIEATVGRNTFVQKLPPASPAGAALEVNSYAFADQAQIKIKQKGVDTSKEYFLIVSQNKKTFINPVTFKDDKEVVFLMRNDALFEGVNTVRLVDEDQNLLSERLFFLAPKQDNALSISGSYTKKDSVALEGKYSAGKAVLSMSVLPAGSVGMNSGYSIFNSLAINPYTNEKSPYATSYFTESTKAKGFDLDLFFIHQSSKTDWNNIQYKKLPSQYYTFDRGISLKGKLNQKVASGNKNRIQLFSLEAQLSEFAELNEKDEFEFKNLILSDSTWVNFSMMDRNRKLIPLKASIQITEKDKKFNKPLDAVLNAHCDIQNTDAEIQQEELPVLKNAIALDQVVIEKKKKSRQEQLSNAHQNILLKGYKGSDLPFFKDLMLVDFLKTKMFTVVKIDGQDTVLSGSGFFTDSKPSTETPTITIEGKSYANKASSTMQGGPKKPQIIIDDVEQYTHEYLLSLRMNQVDEIFYDRTMVVSSAKGQEGMIRVYTKIPDRISTKSEGIIYQIKDGFSRAYAFANDDLIAFGKGFENFGVLHWESNVVTDAKQNFYTKAPLFKQKEIIVFIEGITADGKLISRKETLSINPPY